MVYKYYAIECYPGKWSKVVPIEFHSSSGEAEFIELCILKRTVRLHRETVLEMAPVYGHRVNGEHVRKILIAYGTVKEWSLSSRALYRKLFNISSN